MHDLLRPLAEVRPLRDPILIAGFADHADVSATAADGSPLSVVITRLGTVYVGEVTPEFGCPCRWGKLMDVLITNPHLLSHQLCTFAIELEEHNPGS